MNGGPMDTARIGGMPLLGDRGARSSGAAFTLTSESPKSASIAVGSHFRVSVRRGSDSLVVRGGRSRSCAAAWESALGAAHRGLDLLSLTGSVNLSMRNPEEDYAVWWLDGSDLILRLFAVETSTVEMSARMGVRDASGRLVRQRTKKPAWHESYRFFRLAQVTDDALDAYRNLYLALECLLDEHYPHRRREPEDVWLRRALGQVHQSTSLTHFAPSGAPDPIAAIVQGLYSITRTSVFHAKSSRPHVFPGDRAAMRRVRKSVEPLAGLYLAVVAQELGMRRATSGITLYAFNQMVSSGLWDAIALAVSDDPSPFDPADEEINPAGGAVVALATARAPQYDEDFVCNWFGSVEVASLASLSCVARTGATREGRAAFVQMRHDNLTLGGFDVLEYRLAHRVENQGPRRLYPR
jgi:hypothetical protein